MACPGLRLVAYALESVPCLEYAVVGVTFQELDPWNLALKKF
jgi:hypothetical protein